MEHIRALSLRRGFGLRGRRVGVLAASFVMIPFNTGAQFAFGVMFKPVIRESGWSRSFVSSVFLLNMIVFAVTTTAVGRLYDRFGPRWIIMVSTFFISTGLVLTSFAHSVGQFLCSYGIIAAMGLAGTGVSLLSTVVSKSFDKWRGLAISLAISGSSVGAFVLTPALSLFAASHGWRASYFSLGITIFALNTLLALFAIKGDPRGLAIRTFGEAPDTGNQKAKERGPSLPLDRTPDSRFTRAVAMRSFLLLLVALFINGCGNYFNTSHYINFATDRGFSSLTAGSMMGWYGLLGLVGVLVAGPAADRIGCKTPLVAIFSLRFFLYLFILRYQNMTSLYVFAILFGLTHLVTAPLTPMLVGRLFGLARVGFLTGVVNTIYFLGGGLFTFLGGVIFDKTGSYQSIFLIEAAIAATAALCSSLIVEKRQGKEIAGSKILT